MAMFIVFKEELVAAANAAIAGMPEGVELDLKDKALMERDFKAWVQKTQANNKNPNLSVSFHTHEFMETGVTKSGILVSVDDEKVVQVLNVFRDYGPEYGALLSTIMGVVKSLSAVVKLYKGFLTRLQKDLEKILK